jgi:hypothetical protein
LLVRATAESLDLHHPQQQRILIHQRLERVASEAFQQPEYQFRGL